MILKRWAVIGLWAALGCFVQAQDVFSLAAEAETLTIDRVAETERSEEAVVPVAPAELPAVLEQQVRVEDLPLNVRGNRMERRWRLIPFGRFRMIWDDNLFISNSNPESDLSFTVSPGIAAGWGDYEAEVRQLGEFEHHFEALSLNYEDTRQSFVFAKYVGNASFFTEHPEEDSFDHDALVVGRFESTKLTLGVRLRYQTLSGADIDVGDRVERTVFAGSVTSSYKVSEKTSIELNLYNSTFDYDTQIDWTDWMAETWFNYQFLPKTRISLGARAGITDIKQGETETYEQGLARLTYYASSKVAMSVDGGVEWRQYGGEGNDELFTVFSLSASYAPFDGTLVNFNAFRRNSASASLINETITSTGANARVRQRFFQRLYFTVEGGYQNSEYSSKISATTGGRQDDTVFVKPSVSYDITKNFSAETAYQFQHNDSSVQETTFTENLVTFQLNVQF